MRLFSFFLLASLPISNVLANHCILETAAKDILNYRLKKDCIAKTCRDSDTIGACKNRGCDEEYLSEADRIVSQLKFVKEAWMVEGAEVDSWNIESHRIDCNGLYTKKIICIDDCD